MCPGVHPSAGSLTLLSELKSTHIIRLPCSFKWKKIYILFCLSFRKKKCVVLLPKKGGLALALPSPLVFLNTSPLLPLFDSAAMS